MIFLLTQYFIHRVAKSSLGVDITPIKNGTCMSWKKLKNGQKQTFVFCSRHFFFCHEKCVEIIIDIQTTDMVFLQFNGETSDGISDNYNDFIFILYQKNNGCELYKKNDFDFETYSISR